MILRCKLDNLVLPASINVTIGAVIAWDGDDAFPLERIEAAYYELLDATAEEHANLDRLGYRLLRPGAMPA